MTTRTSLSFSEVTDLRLAVAVFAFRRPQHLRLTLDRLSLAEGFEDATICIFVDGPKSAIDRSLVLETIEVAKTFEQKNSKVGISVSVSVSKTNHGLSESIVSAVTQLCEKHGHAVVLEDDLLVSSNFLTYMKEYLIKYRDCPKVLQISGHAHDTTQGFASFARLTTSWGWATWSDRWTEFIAAREKGDFKIPVARDRGKEFNFNNSYPYDVLLKLQQRGLVNSWAIHFHYHAFNRRMCTLFPPASLVQNIGFDGSGEHCRASRQNAAQASASPFLPPGNVCVDDGREKSIQKSLKGLFGSTYLRRRLGMQYRLIKHRLKNRSHREQSPPSGSTDEAVNG
ncbi:hypothetical protein K227x_18770 [Rubripirellula lacrimiformis]|uniref:Glycosyltransferase 2-like domain-containing protein n=2 Tax=Rubripirellula lacrimiformis TaxID=1930273 RepID=A0A517N8N1_9BACT|nr:hypothetical protein K227x_18770 [Rubripirellula lacrimiformis]